MSGDDPRPCPRPVRRRECGAGTVMAVAIVAVVLIPALLVVAGSGYAVVHRQVVRAADAAALAAADVLSGHAPGTPCDVAARVLAANGAELVGCRLEGAEAVVTADRSWSAVTVRSASRAGPARS